MNTPGSVEGIPELAQITFTRQWSPTTPGVEKKIAFLPLKDGRLVIFPHNRWDPPIGIVIECVLYPARSAAVAAPTGGIPPDEEVTGTDIQASASSAPVDLRKQLARELIDKIAKPLAKIIEALDPEAVMEQ